MRARQSQRLLRHKVHGRTTTLKINGQFYRENHAAARAANVALLRAEPELQIPDDHLEPLAELMRSATTGLAVWWGEHPEVPRATIVDVTVELLARGLGLDRTGSHRD
jgi:hypothetical protein